MIIIRPCGFATMILLFSFLLATSHGVMALSNKATSFAEGDR
jgi:hypothetical protein